MTTDSTVYRTPWAFFALTFTISWVLWLPSVLRSNGFDDLPEIVGLPGVFASWGPAIAAVILIRRSDGGAGVKRLLRRGFALGFDRRWLIPAVLLLPLVGLVSAVVARWFGADVPQWEAPTVVGALATMGAILLIGGGLEEFGWRGYALDRLQSGGNAVAASLQLGFVWGLWHLPLLFIDGTVQAAIPMWQFVLQTMALAILYTWLYNNTGGSLLVAIVFHTIGNTSSALLPEYFGTQTGRWANMGLLLVAIAAVGATSGWRSLNRDRPVPHPSLSG